MAITVSSLHIYPVKGLKGIDLGEARCTERGLEHDRRWMVVDESSTFITQRETPKMATVWTEIEGGALVLSAPDADEVRVPIVGEGREKVRVTVWRSTPEAVFASAEADRWLSDYLERPCRLVYMPDSTRRMSNPDYAGKGKLVGFADGYAYLVANEASLADLNQRLAAKGHGALPMNRFRPNIVLGGAAPFAEDEWGELTMGSATLRGAKPCGRCQVTTTDQSTGEVRGPEPLQTLSTYRDSSRFGVMFGLNCVTVAAGHVTVGDEVRLG